MRAPSIYSPILMPRAPAAGPRFATALAQALRQGEALGLNASRLHELRPMPWIMKGAQRAENAAAASTAAAIPDAPAEWRDLGEQGAAAQVDPHH